MLLELQNLGKSFGEHEVLRDVNAGVERGDRIGIIGANGTGKTTLLRILCGESLPDAGDAAFGTGVTTGYLEQNARLKKVESEIEELGAHIVELENEINDPEVLRDHLLLRDKCDELDDTRFHQQELYDEWEKLAEEQETFENEGE